MLFIVALHKEAEGSTAAFLRQHFAMEQLPLNNCWNTSIYSYLETAGGQSSNPCLNVVNYFTTSSD
jgi:hypothetical protein